MRTTVQVGQTVPEDRYAIALVEEDGSLTLYDTPQEVICDLDPDYLSEPGQVGAYRRRLFLAAHLIDGAQRAALEGTDPTALSDAERWALSARGKRAVTEVAAWEREVPLYVSAVFYAPYASVPLPVGATVIDPATEADLVASLADAGILPAACPVPGQVWRGPGQ